MNEGIKEICNGCEFIYNCPFEYVCVWIANHEG